MQQKAIFIARIFQLTPYEANSNLNAHYLFPLETMRALDEQSIDTIIMQLNPVLVGKGILPIEFLWGSVVNECGKLATESPELSRQILPIILNYCMSLIEMPEFFGMGRLEDFKDSVQHLIVPLALGIPPAHVVQHCFGSEFIHRYPPSELFWSHFYHNLSSPDEEDKLAVFNAALVTQYRRYVESNRRDPAMCARAGSALINIILHFCSSDDAWERFKPHRMFPIDSAKGVDAIRNSPFYAALHPLPSTQECFQRFFQPGVARTMPPDPDSEQEMRKTAKEAATAAQTLFNMLRALLKNKRSRQFAVAHIVRIVTTNHDLRHDIENRTNAVDSEIRLLAVLNTLLELSTPFCGYSDKSRADLMKALDLTVGRSDFARLDEDAPLHHDKALPMRHCDMTQSFTVTCFYLTHACFAQTFTQIFDRSQDLGRRQQQMETVDEESLSALQRAHFKRQHAALLNQIVYSQAMLAATDLSKATTFMLATCDVLNRHDTTDGRALLSSQPETIAENISAMFTVAAGSSPLVLMSAPTFSSFVELAIALLDPEVVRNPHLRGQILAPLMFLLQYRQTEQGSWNLRPYTATAVEKISNIPKAVSLLVPRLMSQFVLVEDHTSEGYYDKFHTRHKISEILLTLWTESKVFKANLSRQESSPLFISFVNKAIGDLTYLTDEFSSSIAQLGSSLTNDGTELNNEELNRQAGSVMAFKQLADITLRLVETLTIEVPAAFLHTALAPQLASQLLLLLATMPAMHAKLPLLCEKFGPEVADPTVVGVTLGTALRILANVSTGYEDRWAAVLAADRRSLRRDVLAPVRKLLGNDAAVPVRCWAQAGIVLSRASKKQLQDEALDDEDVPDEFMDPIMFDAMSRPMRLPCGHHLDESVLERLVINGDLNPWTREPLVMEGAELDVELMERIQAWRHGKRG
ncbi:Ubiquitin elongating factor core [Carpediemonas membranifera]|uniref:Ubiquitin elongating factor core n=1 Tax=Carpediemonas membranifera TaxID=201153 RepID=A0A8J6E3D1_9EUKA|nr:Ubiquitin elongating factor core [Carpediemonas membranifera]|eukprot:KAG9395456.1 Ubiquitin elongating factor core [Carpediemonas membranifera]